MRTILSLLIALELVLGTTGAIWVSQARAQTQTCPEGQAWNAIMARCLSSAQASQFTSASANCESQATDAAKKQCYVAAGEAALKDAEGKKEISEAGKVSPSTMSVILALGGLGASALFLMSGPTCQGPATSAWLIAGGSAAAIMGEIMSGMTYKKKMEEANKALKKINEGSAGTTKQGSESKAVNATNTQEEAFNALIKREEAVIAAAKVKKNLYSVAMLAYGAAAAMAAVEIVQSLTPPYTPNTCSSSAGAMHEGPAQDTLITRYLENYFTLDQRVSFDAYQGRTRNARDMADLQSLILETQYLRAGAHQSHSAQAHQQIARAWQGQPMAKEDFSLIRALSVVTGQLSIMPARADVVAAGTAASAAAHAGASAGAAAAGSGNALTGIMNGLGSQFSSAIQSVSNGVKKLFTNPYTRLAMGGLLMANSMFMISHIGKEQKKAEERKAFLEKLKAQVNIAGSSANCGSADVNSQVSCPTTTPVVPDSESTGAGGDNPGTAGNYGTAKTGTTSTLGTHCIAATGSFDASCGCKTTKSCLNISNRLVGADTGGIALDGLPNTLDGITSGAIDPATIDSAAMGAAAARYKKISDNLAAKNPKVKAAQADAAKRIAKLRSQFEKQFGSDPVLAAADRAGTADLSNASPSEALEKMKEELKQEVTHVTGPAGAEAQPGQPSLDLGLTEEPTVLGAEDPLAKNMASEFELGNNDINTASESNIFDIVSNRYRRSGIRRLFGSEAVIPVDKAAPEQINK